MAEAADWLVSYLGHLGGTEESAKVKEAARKDGHADRTLHRAQLAAYYLSTILERLAT